MHTCWKLAEQTHGVLGTLRAKADEEGESSAPHMYNWDHISLMSGLWRSSHAIVDFYDFERRRTAKVGAILHAFNASLHIYLRTGLFFGSEPLLAYHPGAAPTTSRSLVICS